MRLIVIALSLFMFSCNQTKSVKKENVSQKNDNSNVFFKNINEGDTLVSPFKVEMGVSGMRIKPAGQLEAGTGHHHILLNRAFMKY